MAEVYALRFISGKYQGGEYPLPPDREIVVGRASDLDMVLVEDMVSRKHAKISTQNGLMTIMDLGSTNGTFVNGEKVRKTRLKEGDRILIGTSILKVISTSGAAAMSTSQAREQLEAVGQREQNKGTTTMSGTLEEVPIPDLLQLFSTSKRTGVLHIDAPEGNGKIFLRNGALFYALIDDDHELGPMKALCRIVGWTRGAFDFSPPDETAEFMLELEETTENLLMKALHQLDEYRRIAGDLPAMDRPLRIPHPLVPLLSHLSPLEIDVFQLVYNLSITGSVLDHSPGTDYETAHAILSLISQGYVILD